MAIELVVDTNVLVHATNENYHFQEHCIDIINLIMERDDIVVCLDGSIDGHIYFEYKKHCKVGSIGFTMLLKIATTRLKFIQKKGLPSAINKIINRTGIKPADRIFVWVSYKSNSKILISEEHEDFKEKIRKIIRDEIGVKVIMANECLPKLKESA